MDSRKKKSLLQERLVGLYLRLNGYLQSGYIPHSKVWGNAGTDIDRIAVRFPLHSQLEREAGCSLLEIPENSIDIIIAEVKNYNLEFNESIKNIEKGAQSNWEQMLKWIGIFEIEEIIQLIPALIKIVSKDGESLEGKFEIIEHDNRFGKITIRPILFSIETAKDNDNDKIWLNGSEILSYIWECLCPELKREHCSTRYPFDLWGEEFFDIVKFLKNENELNHSIPTLDELYTNLINV